ncbi:porin [Sorangium sp. So ce1099]|uniref:porin n=1 Tax=Sorangium sp. So ce1099 TaxID=3133331 RepID=UPI003F6276F1
MRHLACVAGGAAVLLALSSPRAQEPEPAAEDLAAAGARPADPQGAQGGEGGELEGAEAPDARPDAPERPRPPQEKQAPASQPPVAAAPVAPAAAGREPIEPGFRERMRFSLGPLELRPIALLALQAAPYVGDDALSQAGDSAEQPGFRLRRVRAGLYGDVAGLVRFAISTELAGGDDGTARIHEAWGGVTAVRALEVYAGARTVPFSRSAMLGAGEGALTERPLAVRAIAPFTQVGVQAEGHFQDRAFSYHAGVYNAFQRADQFYAGQSESLAPLGNRFEGIAVAGRLATEPLGPLGRTLQDVAGSPFRVGAGADGFFSNGGARTLYGASADVLVHASGLHALGEVLWTGASPKSVPTQPIAQVTSVSSLALVFEAGYMIVARKLGVSGRVEWIDPNMDVDDEGDNLVLTGGVSYHAYDDLVKAQLDYTHREELGGLSLANDALILQLQLSL